MENRPFFDPYFLGPNPNLPPNFQPTPNLTPGGLLPHTLSPKDFYESQYLYYRCLNEQLDYTMKSMELEKRLGNSSTPKNQ